jgi:hypothetical protein
MVNDMLPGVRARYRYRFDIGRFCARKRKVEILLMREFNTLIIFELILPQGISTFQSCKN